MKKDNFTELFRDTIVNGQRMQPKIIKRKRQQMNQQLSKCNRKLVGIEFLLGFVTLQGLYYLKAIKRKFELKEQILAIYIEHSNEVFIPNELCMDDLPLSFQYYDSIIFKLKNHIALDRQEFHAEKTKSKIDTYLQKNINMAIVKNLTAEEDGKHHQKFKKVNYQKINFLDHHDTHHTLSLQRSRYL